MGLFQHPPAKSGMTVTSHTGAGVGEQGQVGSREPPLPSPCVPLQNISLRHCVTVSNPSTLTHAGPSLFLRFKAPL